MQRSATVIWNGSIKAGRGMITTESGALHEIPYSFGTRFEEEVGTNPEELIAAAHASCFSMALAGAMEKEQIEVQSIRTTAHVSLEKTNDVWTVGSSHLVVVAQVPFISEDRFHTLVTTVKETCPISRLLNAKISISAKLWGREKAIPTILL